MKQLLTIITLFFTVSSFAQKQENIKIKNDTLIVPLGSCKVIKLGDKYYEIEVNLKEVPKPDTSGNIYLPNWQGGGIKLYTTPNSSENFKSN